MGSQRVRHDQATELRVTECLEFVEENSRREKLSSAEERKSQPSVGPFQKGQAVVLCFFYVTTILKPYAC